MQRFRDFFLGGGVGVGIKGKVSKWKEKQKCESRKGVNKRGQENKGEKISYKSAPNIKYIYRWSPSFFVSLLVFSQRARVREGQREKEREKEEEREG